ncbi:hypothetical protein PAQ31011_00828 [Pandoraea aquatica]|uniref:Uncharacterized protein n=1 Tax=Pandoraea aquatica TaxID=2508290 RepID=A0A5E4SHI5_9BURK|nr:hypothetical protein [Pandoraea aquatica]VVD75150.1 hypothetical protein PAQ31011_00828 [Pandoraea aquatica]
MKEAAQKYQAPDVRQIHDSIRECAELISSKALNPENVGTPLFRPAVTYVLILLNDILQAADDAGMRVSFTDDIKPTDAADDVTTLINKCRNAACHIRSKEKSFGPVTFSFCVVVGRYPQAMEVDGVSVGCDYDDDIGVHFGSRRVYIRRHMIRAIKEAAEKFDYQA